MKNTHSALFAWLLTWSLFSLGSEIHTNMLVDPLGEFTPTQVLSRMPAGTLRPAPSVLPSIDTILRETTLDIPVHMPSMRPHDAYNAAALLMSFSKAKPPMKATPNCKKRELSSKTDDEKGAKKQKNSQAVSQLLSALTLTCKEITNQNLQRLQKNNPCVVRLTIRRDESGASLTSEHIHRLGQFFPSVTQLNLQNTGITASEAGLLPRYFQNLEALVIANNPSLGDAGVVAFANNSRMYAQTHLKVLDVRNTGITELGAQTIAQNFPGLTTLDISNNSINDQGLVYLSCLGGNGLCNNLQVLFANNCNLTQVSMSYITLCLKQLRQLHISRNNFFDAGIQILANSALAKHLDTLAVSQNNLTAQSAEALGKYVNNLKTLDISYNNLEEKGFNYLAESPLAERLVLVNLSYTNLEAPQLLSIAASFVSATSLFIGQRKPINKKNSATLLSQFKDAGFNQPDEKTLYFKKD